MALLSQILTYYFDVIQTLFEFISEYWLLSLVLALHLIYISIIAIKLKRNTD